MDQRLFFVTAISLLFSESQLKMKPQGADVLIKEALSFIKINETHIDGDKTRDTLMSLRTTVLWLIGIYMDRAIDKDTILQRVKLCNDDDTTVYDAVSVFVNKVHASEEKLLETCLDLRASVKNFVSINAYKTLIAKEHRDCVFGDDEIDPTARISELLAKLEPHRTSSNSAIRDKSIVSRVSFDDPASMEEVLNKAKDEISTDGVIQFGVQGLNRTFGIRKGAMRGETVLLTALPYNFKSGMAKLMFKGHALYNKPFMFDEKKKPLLMFISLENEQSSNMRDLYISLYENETGEAADITKVTAAEMSEYIRVRMQATGFHIEMFRIDPSDFTYIQLFDIVLYFESIGYEIQGLYIDYLNMMSKQHCTMGPNGSEIRDLFRRVRNFCTKRGILFVTPHQLSPDAKKLAQSGIEDFVQQVAGKGYLDSSRSIDQEVDYELAMHKVMVGEEAYLTVKRGKHRGMDTTPERDQYCVFKFHDIGGIRDDINGPDTSMRHVGGQTMAEGGGKGWFNR